MGFILGVLIILIIIRVLFSLNEPETNSLIQLKGTTLDGREIVFDTNRHKEVLNPNAISLDLDISVFREGFIDAFKKEKNVEKAIEIAFKRTMLAALQNIKPEYSNLRLSLFNVNIYEMGKTTSCATLLSKGFYVNCIRGSFRTPDKAEVPGFKIKSKYFFSIF